MSLLCTLFCDGCGEDFIDITDCVGDLLDLALQSGWEEEEEGHRCPRCLDVDVID